jgi:hypothetical protein
MRRSDGQVEIESWNPSLGAEPTEQQITDWATDVIPLPSGQLFSAWLAEHGGDSAATARRRARDVLSKANDHSNMVDKAIVLELVDLLNTQASQMEALLTWLGGTNLPNRNQLPGFAFPTPTYQQARTAIVDRITNGETDA